ncbi:MAG: DUF177 domain-containing protein [Lentisphaeria bacterium]|nr:DUF177 domain-containing protein [Lentisphaeria bacterium]
MIRINPANIGMEGEHLSGEEDAALLDLSTFPQKIAPKSAVKYDLHASLAGKDLIVTGSAKVLLLSECAVCLDETEYLLAKKDICIHVENIPMDNFYDLTDEVRENLLLSMPMRIKCKEDCKGLCLSCGANLNKEKCTCKKSRKTAVKTENTANGEKTDWSALDQLKF